jgi:dTDP-4-amino-4,6-dideoxygalactose transaminase
MYSDAFRHIPQLQIPEARPDVVHSWHLYILRLVPGQLRMSRDAFIEELKAHGIQTSVHFIPLHHFTYYRSTYSLRDEQFPVATAEFQRMLSLPIYPSMSDADVQTVIAAVADVVESHVA